MFALKVFLTCVCLYPLLDALSDEFDSMVPAFAANVYIGLGAAIVAVWTAIP